MGGLNSEALRTRAGGGESSLDVRGDLDEIAEVTKRPEDVIGLHFFAPANVMPLLEIVRGAKTARDVIATTMALAKTIRKIGVLVGVCFGFVGNRMFFPYVREAQLMLLEGVSAERIDQVAFDWGMAMGPNSVIDLSGIDVFNKLNSEWKDRPDDPAYYRVCNVLAEMERYGQKTGRGMYIYEGRKAVPDPEVAEIAAREAKTLKELNTLTVSDDASLSDIHKKIDELMNAKREIMRKRYDHLVVMRRVLNTEQRVSYDEAVMKRYEVK